MNKANTKIRFSLKNLKLLIILVGIGIIWKAGYAVAVGRTSLTWASTEGIIEASNIEVEYKPGGSPPHTFYRVNAIYNFKVEGKTYSSDKLTFGGKPTSFTEKGKAELLSKDLSNGASVTVYYDPKNPSNSILFTGVSIVDYILVGIGFFLIFITWVNWNHRKFWQNNLGQTFEFEP